MRCVSLKVALIVAIWIGAAMSIDSVTSSTVENKSTTSTTDVSMVSQTSSSASTTSPPVNTQCSLIANDVNVTESGTFSTSRSTVCACNGGKTHLSVESSETDGGKVYWCLNETAGTASPGPYMPITTIYGPPTSCETFTATTPPGLGHSQSKWTAAIFCTCDHDRTLAWYTVTAVNGNETSGCGAGATDATLIPVTGSSATHATDSASTTTIVTSTSGPMPTVAFEIYVKILPRKSETVPARKFWVGGSGTFNSSMCDIEPPISVPIAESNAEFKDDYPRSLAVIVAGQKECVYVDGNALRPGNIACAMGYMANCVPFSMDSRIIECNETKDSMPFTYTPVFHCLH